MRAVYALIAFLVVAIAFTWIVGRGFGRAGDGGAEAPAPITNPSDINMTSDLTLSSTAFESGASIPSRFTCDGDNASPPLSFGGVPEGAVSLALIMDDPDIPQAVKDSMHIGVFDHWVLYDLPPNTGSLEEGSPPADGAGVEGVNGAGKGGYTGPCPPKQYEPTEHRYFFRLYALDTKLDLPAGSTKAEVLSAMQGHILAEAELMGKYERQ